MKKLLFASCIAAALWAPFPRPLYGEAVANPGAARAVEIAPEFAVPQRMKGRVNFWKMVFAQYGKAHVVIHHREYPQIIFEILDLGDEYQSMSDVAFDRFKKQAGTRAVERLQGVFRYLATGGRPRDAMETRIVETMDLLPDGLRKYRRMLDEDLIRTQTGMKEKFEQSIVRSGRYLPIMERIFVQEYKLPIELTRLPFVESSFDYLAYSSVGAAGIWQFMPRTAKLHKMTVSKFVDERRDPIAATRAAAEYLRHAYEVLETWPLAMTSYNHGIYGVSKKVKARGTRDISSLVEDTNEQAFGFASNNFYASFLAALHIYSNRNAYFPLIEIERPIDFTSVRLPYSASVNYLCSQLNMTKDQLQQANYALLKPIWDGRAKVPAGYVLRIPRQHERYVLNLRAPEVETVKAPAPPSSAIYGGTTYKVRKGDTMLSIAKRYGVSTAQLQQLNDLPNQNVRVGQTLIVKGSEAKSAPPPPAPKSKSAPPPKPAVKSYRVKSGDSLWSIARQFNVSVDALKKANKKASAKLTPGAVLAIP